MVYINLTLSALKWAALFPVHIGMILLCYLLSPILPVFAIGRETLPSWLSWFQTPDSPLSGDEGFQNVYPNIKWVYLRRVLWLIRNPAYGFAWSILAAEIPEGVQIHYRGDPFAREQQPGYTVCWTEDGKYFQLRYYRPTVFGKHLKFRIGWKMVYWVRVHSGFGTGSKAKYVFTCNPFKNG